MIAKFRNVPRLETAPCFVKGGIPDSGTTLPSNGPLERALHLADEDTFSGKRGSELESFKCPLSTGLHQHTAEQRTSPISPFRRKICSLVTHTQLAQRGRDSMTEKTPWMCIKRENYLFATASRKVVLRLQDLIPLEENTDRRGSPLPPSSNY